MADKMEMAEKGQVNLAYYGKTDGDDNITPKSASPDDVNLKVDPHNNHHHHDHAAVDNHHEPAPGEDEDEEASFEVDPATGDIIFEKKVMKDNINSCAKAVGRVQTDIGEFYTKNERMIWIVIGVKLLLAYYVYVIYSMVDRGIDGEGQMRLLVCTILLTLLLVFHWLGNSLQPIYDAVNNFMINPKFARNRMWIQWTLYIVSTVVTVTLIIVLVAVETPENLLSLAGLAALMLICYLTSFSPAMIDWHPVFWGFSLQFYFAVIILKTRWGFQAFDWLGDRVTEFLLHSDEGAKFVFGDLGFFNFQDGTTFDIKSALMADGSTMNITKLTLADASQVVFTAVFTIHFFAFKVLPVVIFFSAFIGILTYLGVMKFIIKSVGLFLSFCLGTTPAESLNAAGNIFVGMTESPLMIRPFIGKMTSSELHAVMTGGFATIAGSVLGVYIGFGVPADHLLSASVMSAPAALAISKMTYPEIEKPIIKAQSYEKVENSEDSNLVQAACNGATMSGKICAAILVNVVAFLSLLKFVNATLTWLGDRVGVDDLTFEYICSYVLYPVALFMGVDMDDCRQVAELIGIKTFTNEFIAFSKLSVLQSNRKDFDEYVTAYPNSTWHTSGDDIYLHDVNKVLAKGFMEKRSEVIATYALCGFSNFGSMGILLGSLTALAPNRGPTMSRLVFRAMIAGNIACFFTACIAGLFFEEFD